MEKKKRRRIAVISAFISGYYLGEIVDNLRLQSIEHDFDLIAIETRSFKTYELTVALGNVDGVIIIIDSISSKLANEIASNNIPVISIGYDYFPAKIETVQIDNINGMIQILDHLVDLGHKKIGFAGDVSVHDFSLRYQAYKKYIQEHNLSLEQSMIFDVTGNDQQGGTKIAEEFISRNRPCTAMVFATDITAAGFHKKMLASNIKIPEDVAIAGFDNAIIAAMCIPQITTIDQNLPHLSKYVVKRILEKIDGAPFFKAVNLPCTILKRSSTTGEKNFLPVVELKDKDSTSLKIMEGIVSNNFESMKAIILNNNDGGNIVNAFGSFFKFACVAKWKDPNKPETLIIDNLINDFSNNQQEYKLGDEIAKKEFPFDHLFNINSKNHIVSVFPLMFKHRLWGIFAISGEADNNDLYSSYQIFANHMEVLVSIMEKEKLLDMVVQKEEHHKTLTDELKVISNNSTDGVWIWDCKKNIFEWNIKALNMIGYQNEIDLKSTKNIPIYEMAHIEDMYKVKNEFQSLLKNKQKSSIEFRISNKSNNFIWIKSKAETIFDEEGQPSRIIGTITDLSERHEHINKIKYMSLYDELTGLPNRANMRLELDKIISLNNDQVLAVLLLDLDRFKLLNDSHGHIAGDRLLIHISKIISAELRSVDLLYRIGGDEFVIICPIQTGKEALTIADRVLESIRTPYIDETGFEFHLSSSIGIAQYPNHGKNTQQLIKNADIAMYQAKKVGKNCIIQFKDDMANTFQGKFDMERLLRKALKNREFNIFIQPQFNIESSKLVGGEVLIRWFSAELGQISPVEFIPIAEETDLIIPIGAWVLNESCKLIKRFKEDYSFNIDLSINVSPAQILRSDFVKIIKASIKNNDIDPHNICIEVTESMAINNIEHTILVINELKKIGIQISLDDFGTGYSSLSVLKELPLDELKIDKSFLPENDKEGKEWAIIQSIITMGHALGIRIVTEGVENIQQLNVLKSMGCDIAQGFYLGKPQPVEDFIKLLNLN
ncbi:MAG: EAL domain-containing protein [Spirochaetaceae bacterium]